MNKKQEKIALKLILLIKNKEGFISADEIIESKIIDLSDNNTDTVVINGLADLELIDISVKYAFRLTEKGWKFKSFRKLYFDNKLQLINTKIILIIAIISILLNIYKIFF